MAKKRITSYTFDASAKTIQFAFNPDIEGFLVITNVVDGIIIYQFNDSAKGGTVSTDTLTLEYDTTSMSDSDELQILYDDGLPTEVDTGLTTQTDALTDTELRANPVEVDVTATVLPTDAAVESKQDDIITKLTELKALIGEVQASPTTNSLLERLKVLNTSLGTINTSLGTLDGHVDNLEGYTDSIESLLGDLKTYTDNLEGYTDGLESALSTTNSTLTTIDGRVDGLEGLITTLNGYVDGLETLLGVAANTSIPATQNITVVDSGSSTSGSEGTLVTGTPTAGSTATFDVRGYSALVVQTSGTFTGTLAFERSADGGTTWAAFTVKRGSGSNLATTTAGPSVYMAAIAGFTHFRMRATAFSAGTATIGISLSTQVSVADNMNATRLFDSTTASTLSITGGAAKVEGTGTFAVQDSEKIADDGTFTVGTTKVQPAGYLADETSTDSVDEGDAGIARMTPDRKQIVTIQPHTAGGWDVKSCTSGDSLTALTNSAQAIKASAGKLGGWYIYNPNASATYVILYNVASGSVTVGTTNPLMVLCVPATSGANMELVNGITFDTAISVAATTTGGGNSAPATALEANFWFK